MEMGKQRITSSQDSCLFVTKLHVALVIFVDINVNAYLSKTEFPDHLRN
jgi:hypothetical protein